MQELKANTQVIVTVGPFVDVGDGFTPETGITLGAADEAELLKHGSTTVVDISAATWAAVASLDGYYSLTLTTSHTDTEGMLLVVVQDDSVCLPVKAEYMVLSQAAYDSKYAAKDTGYMDVNVKAVSEDTTAADNLELACDNYSATRGLTGTALPAAAADAAGGLPISDAGGLDMDAMSMLTLTGTANAGDSVRQITLTGGVALDNYYNGQIVRIELGTGIGQARTILSYVGATAVATPARDWVTAPDGTSVFVVYAADWPALLHAGTIVSSADTTHAVLNVGASAITGTYQGAHIVFTGGTGSGQTRVIGAYVGGTRTVTVIPAWVTQPDATTIYQIVPQGRVDIAAVMGTAQTASDLAADIAAVKAETALIVADTNELQNDDVPGLIAALDAVVDTVKTETALIVADTNELQTDWADGGRLDLIQDIIAADTTTDIPALIATAQTDLDTITGTGGVELGTSQTAAWASGLEASAGTIKEGLAEAGTLSTTQMTTNLTEVNDVFNGRILIFKADTTTAALRLQATDITDYANASGLLTFTAVTTEPAVGESFIIV
jgi:hypothetical protein